MATKKKAKTSKTLKKGEGAGASKKATKRTPTRPANKTAKKEAKAPRKVARAAPSKKATKRTPTRPANKRLKTPEKAVKKQPPVQPPKTFTENVQDCEAGTAVWFITAGSVEHATIQKRSGDGAVVILTDAGVTEVVPASNLFETAEQARAARY
jgi:hypothetical protein